MRRRTPLTHPIIAMVSLVVSALDNDMLIIVLSAKQLLRTAQR